MNYYVNRPIDEKQYDSGVSHISVDYIHMRDDNCYTCKEDLENYTIPLLRRPMIESLRNKLAEEKDKKTINERPKFIPVITNYEKALIIEICIFASFVGSSWKIGFENPLSIKSVGNNFQNRRLQYSYKVHDMDETNNDIVCLRNTEMPKSLYYVDPWANRNNINVNNVLTEHSTGVMSLKESAIHLVRYHTNIQKKDEFEVVDSVNPNGYKYPEFYIVGIKDKYYVHQQKSLEEMKDRFKEIEAGRKEKLVHNKAGGSGGGNDTFNLDDYKKILKEQGPLEVKTCYNLSGAKYPYNYCIKAIDNDSNNSNVHVVSFEKVDATKSFKLNPFARFKVLPLTGAPIPLDILKSSQVFNSNTIPLKDYVSYKCDSEHDNDESERAQYLADNYIPVANDLVTSIGTREAFFDHYTMLSIADHHAEIYNIRDTPLIGKLSLCYNPTVDTETMSKGFDQLQYLVKYLKLSPNTQPVDLSALPYELRLYLQLVNREGVSVACSDSPTRSKPLFRMVSMLPFGYPQMRSILLFLFANVIDGTVVDEKVSVRGFKPYHVVSFRCKTGDEAASCVLYLWEQELEVLYSIRRYLQSARMEFAKIAIELSGRDYRIQERYSKFMELVGHLREATGYKPVTLVHDILASLGFGVGVLGKNIRDPVSGGSGERQIGVPDYDAAYARVLSKYMKENEELKRLVANLEGKNNNNNNNNENW